MEENKDATAAPTECLVCFDDLTAETLIEYLSSGHWHWSHFCAACIESIRVSAFSHYTHQLQNSNCAKEQRVLLERGPPINVRDPNGFPHAMHGEVEALRIWKTKVSIPCRCEGAVEGEERDKLLAALQHFIIQGE